MQYAVGKFVKTTGIKVTAYTDKECTTDNTVASSVSTGIMDTTVCLRPGSTVSVWAKGFTTLPVNATTPADYVCGYSDSECKTVLMCNKVTDGCKMVKTGK
eukprot:GHVR01175710.1.p1 GENE.GHVR01175710.1~~GHVR01175710.1.p1  ORF type:complete len:101 (-),score=9.50 GHVR01175710.1:135-437(-)